MSSFFSPKDLILYLQTYIPRVSDRFSDKLIVNYTIVPGNPQILRIKTPAVNNSQAGDSVVFSDGEIKNEIVNVELINSNIVRFETKTPHDLTKSYQKTVRLEGFSDTNFNGDFPLIDVPSRTTFDISGTTIPSAPFGSLVENWEIGINGLFQIARIISNDTYEIDLVGLPNFGESTGNITQSYNFRISVSVDVDRAQAVYTKQQDSEKLWLFLIMEDSQASKDRRILTDANQQNTAGNAARILMVNSFSLVVFFPTTTSLLAARAIEEAWEEILILMFSVVSGIRFDDFGNTRYRASLLDHTTGIYTNSFYTHIYRFEYNYEITNEETSLTKFIKSRAFREIHLDFSDPSSGSFINLDDKP